MKIVGMILGCTLALATAGVAADAPASGLVAHYFADPLQWDGNWPDAISVPKVSPSAWTFREYKYSRVEPCINHLFIRNGWFSVRWTGYLDVGGGPGGGDELHWISGVINLNPNNRSDFEFTLVTGSGRTLTRDDLAGNFAGYEGPAVSLRVRPKGNGNQNGLTVDGKPYPLRNANTYEIAGTLNVRLYNEETGNANRPMGRWYIAVSAGDATIVCQENGAASAASGSAPNANAGGGGGGGVSRGAAADYTFEIWADDGCRLFLDGQSLIDDWRACWEQAPESVRKTASVRLTPGKHKIVVEYFQGQSLKDGDRDPMKLFWSSAAAGVPRQVIPASCFSHGPENLATPNP